MVDDPLKNKIYPVDPGVAGAPPFGEITVEFDPPSPIKNTNTGRPDVVIVACKFVIFTGLALVVVKFPQLEVIV